MITEEKLSILRDGISALLSEHRYTHTLGVEKMACIIADFCLPDRKNEISAAALLHDVTKETDVDVQLRLIENAGDILSPEDAACLPALHSFSAPYAVLRSFPDFATADILSAVKKHTLGDAFMSVFDEIIFLSDFIELGRENESSVKVRDYVLGSMKQGKIEANIKLLHRACIMEIDSTIEYLRVKKSRVHKRTLEARASLLSKI